MGGGYDGGVWTRSEAVRDVHGRSRVVGEEGRGGGEVFRHLRLLRHREEGPQDITALLLGLRAQLTEVHLDTEGVVEEISQPETEITLTPQSVSLSLT